MFLELADKIVEDALVECIIGSRVRMRAILQIFKHRSNETILDCGCGTGANSARLARDHREVVGLDLAGKTLLRAKKRYSSPHFVLGDATRLPFRESSFDLIICSDVLEHIPNDDRAMSEISKSLADRGSGIFTVPVDLERNWVWSVRRFFGLDPRFWRDFYLHLRDGYSTEAFFLLLKNHNLSVQRFSYCYGLFSSIMESLVIGILRRSSEDPKRIRSFELSERQKFLLIVYRIIFPILLLISYLDFLIPFDQLKSDLVVVSQKTSDPNS